MRCGLCGGTTTRWQRIKGHDIVECQRCGHRQAELAASADPVHHAEAVYGDAYFTEGGAGYVDYHAEADLLRRRGERYGRILARHATPGHLLDVGAAAGYLLEGLAEAGWSGTGIEPNMDMAEAARSRGVDVRVGLADEATLSAQRIAEGSLDAISMIQVIAHVLDPVASLRALTRRLRPGGLLLVETWDRSSLTARALGTRWHEWSPPSVVHWFRRPELDATATRVGLLPVAHGRMAKQIAAAHAAALLTAGNPDGAASRLARRIPPRAVLPYPAEDLFWALYRRPAAA
jgi:SAM-dependent methyltransferase